MRPAAALLLLALTGCASTAPAGALLANTPSAGAAPARTSAATVPSIPAPPRATTAATLSTAATSSWPRPGPSQDPSPVIGTVGPVAWLPLPYQAPVEQNDPTEPVGKPPWCTAGDLEMASSTLDAGGGFFYFGYSLTARPGRRCSLQGYPAFRVGDARRTWSVTNRAPDLFPVQPGGVVDDHHPGSAELRWAGGGACITVDTSHLVVALDLPHQGGRLSVHQNPRAWGCSATMKADEPANTGWIIVEPLVASAPTVYAASPPVQVSLPSQPRSVRAGSTLAYQIQLDGHEVLGPSVGYRERLIQYDTGAVITTKTYRLNVAGLPALTRLGTLLDMELPVPSDVPVGTKVYVDWETDIAGSGLDGTGPVPVTVVAADS